MSLNLDVPSPLQYFASLVQSDEHFPLLEAAISLAQDEYPDLDVQQVLNGAALTHWQKPEVNTYVRDSGDIAANLVKLGAIILFYLKE